MKRMTMMIALLAVGMMTAAATAEDEKGNRRAGGKARAAGERPQGERPAGGRPGAGGQDPAKMVATMLERFDKDGDQKLDKTELTALFKSMQERRGGGGQAGAAGRKPGAAGKRGAGEGRQKGGEGKQKGGVRPERPKAE